MLKQNVRISCPILHGLAFSTPTILSVKHWLMNSLLFSVAHLQASCFQVRRPNKDFLFLPYSTYAATNKLAPVEKIQTIFHTYVFSFPTNQPVMLKASVQPMEGICKNIHTYTSMYNYIYPNIRLVKCFGTASNSFVFISSMTNAAMFAGKGFSGILYFLISHSTDAIIM